MSCNIRSFISILMGQLDKNNKHQAFIFSILRKRAEEDSFFTDCEYLDSKDVDSKFMSSHLGALFTWSESHEGHEFWQKISKMKSSDSIDFIKISEKIRIKLGLSEYEAYEDDIIENLDTIIDKLQTICENLK